MVSKANIAPLLRFHTNPEELGPLLRFCNTLAAGRVGEEGSNFDGALSLFHSPEELQEALGSGDLSNEVATVVVFAGERESDDEDPESE